MSDLDPPDDLQVTPPERQLWQHFRNGTALDLRTGELDRDDPATLTPWGPDRTVRADVIARLLLHGPDPEPGKVAALKLSGAFISGRLQLSGGTVVPYVELNGCRFEEQLMLPEAAVTTWRLVRCAIPRIEAARLTTTGDLHLPQCLVPGGIRLSDAQIGTDLMLNQAQLGPWRRGLALSGDGLSVGQDFDAESLRATGELSLRSARIGGRLSLRRSTLSNPNGFALNAARIQVEHTLYLSAGFRAEGAVRLDDARLNYACLIDNAEFRLAPGQVFSMRRIQTPELRYMPGIPPTGRVVLTRARVGNLVDVPGGWPVESGQLGLTGFTYESVPAERTFPLLDRLAWLEAATPDYRPEPYEQLATALRTEGRDRAAREVLLAKQRHRRAVVPLVPRLWGFVQDWTVAYGYRPGRAAIWMGVLWALGAVYFALDQPPPLKDDEKPHWNAVLYALDQLLPVVDLGQSGGWNPVGAGQWVAAVLVLLGWTLATTVATGATRVLARR
jgi:hypothetical protein